MWEGILIFIIVVAIICLLAAAVDSSRFVKVTYEIKSDKLTKPCKMVLLSDLHNKSFGRENHRLLAAIDGISPDAVLVAGDMLTARKASLYETAHHNSVGRRQWDY